MKSTEPKPLGPHGSPFPKNEQRTYDSEAFVQVHFTITADGHVKDPVLVKEVGPKDFADTALEAIKTWTYVPATANGVPVETPNWDVEMTYSFNPPVTGARDSVYSDYNKAKDLIDARNYSGAIALLTPVLSLERLNFYEREMVSLLLSASYLGLKDYITVGEYAEAATLFNGRYLTPPARTMTIRLRITADVMTGDYADAFSWYGTLKKTESVGPDDPVTKLIDIANARLADPNPIHVSGRIPAIGYVNLWSHTLLRRNFSFPTVTGKLANFVLDCDQQSLQSVISTTAEWHVPKSWSRCSLRVRGDPGATFTLLEANE